MFLLKYKKRNLAITFICFGSFLLIFNLSKKKIKKNKDLKKINAISFGPTGANFSYQLGIAKYIQNNFNIENFKYACVSGGIQSAICLSYQMDIDLFFKEFTLKTFNMKNNYYEIFDISRKYAKLNLENKNCLNKVKTCKNLYIGLTGIYPYFYSESINSYKNFDDLFDCILATQCIPFAFGYSHYNFRKKMYIDGYLSNIYFKPTNDNWLYIDIFDYCDKFSYFEYFFSGLINLKYLRNENFHKNQFIRGFNDAKRNHKKLINKGLIEK